MKTTKIITILSVILVVGGTLFLIYRDQSIAVAINDLISNPSLYNGRKIKTSGVYVSAFEANALGTTTEKRDGVIHLKEPAIWLEGDTVKNKQNCATYNKGLTTFCEATVEGTFYYGGQYGHVGQYKFQISQ